MHQTLPVKLVNHNHMLFFKSIYELIPLTDDFQSFFSENVTEMTAGALLSLMSDEPNCWMQIYPNYQIYGESRGNKNGFCLKLHFHNKLYM